jgi:hypothetical protein
LGLEIIEGSDLVKKDSLNTNAQILDGVVPIFPAVQLTTLPPGSWTVRAAGGYQQTLAVPGVTADPLACQVEIRLAADLGSAEWAAYQNMQLNDYLSSQADGSITVVIMGYVPVIAIPIIVEVRK